MSIHDALELEMEEPFTIKIEETAVNKKYPISWWLRRILTLDGIPHQKDHRPVFIICMSILHVFTYLLTFIDSKWRGQKVVYTLFDLCKFFVPCMRPTPYDIRIRIVNCEQSMGNGTCHYDDVLKHMCFSFTYPHQIWRMVSVNLLHMDWLHLLSNLLAQLVQGIPLERKYGSIRTAVIYWLSDLGASLSFMLKHAKEPAVGASGSLYGLTLFLVVDRFIALQANTGHRFFIIVQLVLLLSPHIVASIPLIIKYNVAHSAHLGGGLVGFLLSVGMFGCPWPWNNPFGISQTTCRQTAFILLLLYYIITFTIFFRKSAPTVDSIIHNF